MALSYSKLMANNPFEYARIVNSKGQTVVFYEHPFYGDEAEVICAFPEFEKCFYSGFMETDDMTREHGDYEPSMIDGNFYIGEFIV